MKVDVITRLSACSLSEPGYLMFKEGVNMPGFIVVTGHASLVCNDAAAKFLQAGLT